MPLNRFLPLHFRQSLTAAVQTSHKIGTRRFCVQSRHKQEQQKLQQEQANPLGSLFAASEPVEQQKSSESTSSEGAVPVGTLFAVGLGMVGLAWYNGFFENFLGVPKVTPAQRRPDFNSAATVVPPSVKVTISARRRVSRQVSMNQSRAELDKAEEAAAALAAFDNKMANNRNEFPDNLAAKYFDAEWVATLPADQQAAMMACAISGAENGDSLMGCYAMQPDDYDRFKPFFGKVVAAYHKCDEGTKQVNDWNIAETYDLKNLGYGRPVSMRVRVGRNLEKYPLPGAMSAEDRTNMENDLTAAFESLISKYGGSYHSLTSGHRNFIEDAKYQELVDAHMMFNNMSADSYLVTAGLASDWPTGRGCYVSKGKELIVWVGEEDHLRIMCMKKGSVLNEVFDGLKELLDSVEATGVKFVHSNEFGYITSCPTNLGTGMRASVHVKVPNLTSDGTDAKVKAICKPLGLSVRGTGGEHTPIGADGTIDLSPSKRFNIKECEIVGRLYQGISQLEEAESAAAPAE